MTASFSERIESIALFLPYYLGRALICLAERNQAEATSALKRQLASGHTWTVAPALLVPVHTERVSAHLASTLPEGPLRFYLTLISEGRVTLDSLGILVDRLSNKTTAINVKLTYV